MSEQKTPVSLLEMAKGFFIDTNFNRVLAISKIDYALNAGKNHINMVA